MAMRWGVCVCGVLAVMQQAVGSEPGVSIGADWGQTCNARDGMSPQDVAIFNLSPGESTPVQLGPLTFGGSVHAYAGIFLNTYSPWARIFDFGNGAGKDNVLLTLAEDTQSLMLQVFRHGVPKQVICKSPLSLKRRHSVEVTITESGVDVLGRIYVDGQECGVGPLHLPEVMARSSNLLGGSNWEGNLPLDGTVQEFGITACRMQRICDNAKDAVNVQSNMGAFDEQAPLTFGGPTNVRARVTLNSHTPWGRIIDFGNGPAGDNVIVTLRDSTKQIAVIVYREGEGKEVVCPVDAPLGASFTVEANILRDGSSAIQGVATIYIDGVECIKGLVPLPAVVERRKNYVGHSQWEGNAPLDGAVSSLVISSCPLPCASAKQVVRAHDVASFNEAAARLSFGGGIYARATVLFRTLTPWARVFDFGNGAEQDNVFLGLAENTKQIVLEVWRGKVAQNMMCTYDMPLNTAVTVEAIITRYSGPSVDGLGSIYIDGVECGRGALHLPRMVERNRNYLGRSNWVADAALDGTVHNFEFSSCMASP